MRLQELKHDSPWLRSFLRMIRERPAMYLGDSKVDTLSHWIDGYVTARQDLGIEAFVGDEVGLLDGFTHWLAVKLPTTITCQWEGIIRLEKDGSEFSVQTFFRLFDEYEEALRTTSLSELEKLYENLFGL